MALAIATQTAGCLSTSNTRTGVASVNAIQGGQGLTDVAHTSTPAANATVGRVHMVTGVDTIRGQMAGYVGIAPGANVGSAVTSGSASYNAKYAYQKITGIKRTSTRISGLRTAGTGTVLLNADFGSGQLIGSNGTVSVDGTINGTSLGGTVDVTGAPTATLSGKIGSTGVIGAFHGANPNSLVVGGFVGTKE